MANTKEEIVQGLYNLIQKKKNEIAKSERPNWETNCNFRFNRETTTSINLQVCSSIEDLTEMLGFLMTKQYFHQAAQDELGLKLKFKWLGFTVEQWTSDIKTRVGKLELVSKKKELESLEDRLNKLELTKEMREQMELEAIVKLLGND